MTENEILLPPDCIPFKELVVCGNTMIDGKVPIRIKGHLPMIVGKGNVPLIWLYATKDGKEWQLAVEKNISQKSNISVNYFTDGKSLIIYSGSVIIIHAIKISDEKAEIDSMDLRPLGMDFHGNKAGLYIGTNLFAGNIFQGVPTMIDIG